jgi:exopolysaccharide biosynthesis protein
MTPHLARPRIRFAAVFALFLSAALLSAQPLPRDTQSAPAVAAERVADGVLLHRLDDPALLSPAGPVSVQALQLDPKKVRLETGVAENVTPARETVESIARRRGALAAVNAGFFALADGKPVALLKSAGALLGRARRSRGAVALSDRRGRPHLLFDRVTVEGTANDAKSYRTRLGTKPKDWANARDAVSGAGLLMLDGREFHEWTDEGLAAGFDTTRHPRTVIGVDANDAVWLITVDGRQPALSLGMSFTELQGLARRLGLRSVLNLDGGGSTTMVVRGNIVNHPSDATGPRPVSDAILVFPRTP